MCRPSLIVAAFALIISGCHQIRDAHAQSQINTHYEIFGSGEPILLINGGPGFSSEGFKSIAQQLSDSLKYKVIIYDQRGTGQTLMKVLDENTITMKLMAEDIEILREKLNIEKWVVMGHSFGGMMGYFYTSLYPNRVTALIQSSSGGMDLSLMGNSNIQNRLTQTEQDSLAFYSRKINEGDTTFASLLKRAQFMAPAYVVDKKYVPAIAERLTQGNMALNGLVWRNLMDNEYDVKDFFRNFKKPVLIIHGKEDVVPIKEAEIAHEILPNSKLVILENSSHYGWLDRPEQYFKAIEEFLN